MCIVFGRATALTAKGIGHVGSYVMDKSTARKRVVLKLESAFSFTPSFSCDSYLAEQVRIADCNSASKVHTACNDIVQVGGWVALRIRGSEEEEVSELAPENVSK